jgi:hypothetical protein
MPRHEFALDSNHNKLKQYWVVKDTICGNPNDCDEFDNIFMTVLSARVDATVWKESLDRATQMHIQRKDKRQ